MRVYIAPLGLWLTLDSGTFETIEINLQTNALRVGLSSATQFTPIARLHVEQLAHPKGAGAYRLAQNLKSERGAYVIPLSSKTTWLELTSKP